MTLVERLKKKFISHNSVPISSIRISREEFDEIEKELNRANQCADHYRKISEIAISLAEKELKTQDT